MKRGRPAVNIEDVQLERTSVGWRVAIIFNNDACYKLPGTFDNCSEAKEAAKKVIEHARIIAGVLPKRGKIQKKTDAGYLKSLDFVGNLLGYAPLTQTERTTIVETSKKRRRKDRALRNLPKARAGNKRKGVTTQKKVKELDAELTSEGMQSNRRKVAIARRLNIKRDTVHRLLKKADFPTQ